MRTAFIACAVVFLLSATVASAAPLEDLVRASLLQQASLAYGSVLRDGVAAGRLYTREATVSGAKRHAEEFVARQYVPLPKRSSAQ
jgi:hypothetical protein